MKNVLMIAYDFPPVGGSGMLRTVKFVKYLPVFGWHPIVLAIEKNAENIAYVDSSLLDSLNKNATIYRARIIEPYHLYRIFGGKQKQGSRESSVLHANTDGGGFGTKLRNIFQSFLIPDSKIGWFPGAIKRGRKIFRDHSIDAIYSTSPKNTAHIIARWLSIKYKKPWIADFRDPWSGYFVKPPMLFRQLDCFMEKNVIDSAQRIIAAWPGILNDVKDRYGKSYDDKCVLLPNGFDEEDYVDISPVVCKQFTIAYAGIFYKDRTPESLFRGLSMLFKERPELKNNIRVVFIGIRDPLLNNLIKNYDLGDVINHVTYCSHKECLNYLSGAHALFLNTLENCVPGKLYEYIGLRRPILALVPETTVVAEIINETQAGSVIDPGETCKIKNTILSLYEKYNKGTLTLDREDESCIYKYERKRLTEKLSKLLVEVS